MTITISYPAFLLTVVSGVVVVALVYLVVVLARVNRTFVKLDSILGQTDTLLGSLKSLMDESTTTVVSARQLIDEGHRVVADFTAVSGRMRDLAESDAARALSLIERLKSFVAVFAGVKTAMASVKHFMERRRHAAAEESNT